MTDASTASCRIVRCTSAAKDSRCPQGLKGVIRQPRWSQRFASLRTPLWQSLSGVFFCGRPAVMAERACLHSRRCNSCPALQTSTCSRRAPVPLRPPRASFRLPALPRNASSQAASTPHWPIETSMPRPWAYFCAHCAARLAPRAYPPPSPLSGIAQVCAGPARGLVTALKAVADEKDAA